MKRLLVVLGPFVAASALAFACTSNSSPAGTPGGGSGSGSGGGSGGGGCVEADDAGTVYGCLVVRTNGVSGASDQADCTPSMMTYVASCPTASLVGCCTSPDNTGGNVTSTEEECYYNAEFDGSEFCVACGLNSDGSPKTPAQTQATCEATGVAGLNAGTWSTTP